MTEGCRCQCHKDPWKLCDDCCLKAALARAAELEVRFETAARLLVDAQAQVATLQAERAAVAQALLAARGLELGTLVEGVQALHAELREERAAAVENALHPAAPALIAHIYDDDEDPSLGPLCGREPASAPRYVGPSPDGLRVVQCPACARIASEPELLDDADLDSKVDWRGPKEAL